MSEKFLLTTQPMARIKPYLPPLSHDISQVDDRRVRSGISSVIRYGRQRSD